MRTREEVFAAGDVGMARWTEHYFTVLAPGGNIDSSRWTEEERRNIVAMHWWSLENLRSAAEPVLPGWLPETLASLLAAREVRAADPLVAGEQAATPNHPHGLN